MHPQKLSLQTFFSPHRCDLWFILTKEVPRLSCGVTSDILTFIYLEMEFCPLNCAFYSATLDSALLLPEVPVPRSKSSSCC